MTTQPAVAPAIGTGTSAPTRRHPAFDAAPGYLNAATLGLPPRATADAVRDAVDAWQRGYACAVGYDVVVNRARELYARLVGVPAAWVAIGSQVSVAAGT